MIFVEVVGDGNGGNFTRVGVSSREIGEIQFII
jgi:hypothetical protein